MRGGEEERRREGEKERRRGGEDTRTWGAAQSIHSLSNRHRMGLTDTRKTSRALAVARGAVGSSAHHWGSGRGEEYGKTRSRPAATCHCGSGTGTSLARVRRPHAHELVNDLPVKRQVASALDLE